MRNSDLRLHQTVVILGTNISAHMCAAYLRKHNPTLKISVIGKVNPQLPMVGESLTEFSTQFFHDIGLGEHLEEHHYHKYGLTFYFKEDSTNSASRTYAVHEALQAPSMPANLINRFILDPHMREHSEALGAEVIDARIEAIVKNSDGSFNICYVDSSSQERIVKADFVVDATGRSRLLARSFGVEKHHRHARSSFWFRLADFDRRKLLNIDAKKTPHQNFNSYYVTHHFLGKGNWLWLIPLKSEEYDDLISIGITWHPDHYPHKINCIEDFMRAVAEEHPVVCDLINSGTVVDTALYANYLYEVDNIYSADRWFLLGDSGDAVDPLYSTGVVMTSIQITQISRLIDFAIQDRLTAEVASEFEQTYKALRNAVQGGISQFYQIMDDAYQSHWRMHMISTYYFYFLLPSWLNGYMSNLRGIRWFKQEMMRGLNDYLSLLSMVEPATSRLRAESGGTIPAKYIRNRYNDSVDWQIRGANEAALPLSLSKLWWRFSKYRIELLWRSGFRDFVNQALALMRGVTRSLALRCVYHVPLLQSIPLLQRWVGLPVQAVADEVPPFALGTPVQVWRRKRHVPSGGESALRDVA